MARRYGTGVRILAGLYAILALSAFAAWVTHVYVCLKLGLWGFLIAGALFFPIGIIHGYGIWFGYW